MTAIQRIAAFDVDGTIVSGQTQALLVRHLAKRHMLPLSTSVAVAAWFLGYRIGLPVRHEGIRRRVLRSLTGLTEAQIESIAVELVSGSIRPRVRRDAVATIETLRQQGVMCVLVSASAAPIVRQIAIEVGASAVVATELDAPHGVLSGEIAGPVVEGAHKLPRLSAWADVEFGSWELVEAYGDHESDVGLLSAAQRSVAVNPTGQLRRIAVERGWDCVDWNVGGCLS